MRKEWIYIFTIIFFGIVLTLFEYFNSDKSYQLSPSTGLPSNVVCPKLECFVACIREVETGGQKNGGSSAIGDGGNSHGPYQIQQGTIGYATNYDSTLDGVLATSLSGKTGKLTEDERKALSEKIMYANWARAATANPERLKKTWTCEDLARIHNGGPTGHKKKATIAYWDKVKTCYAKCP